MEISYEKGDKVFHVKRGTKHVVQHAYVGPGAEGEQMVCVEFSRKYIRARNYRPVSIEIGGRIYKAQEPVAKHLPMTSDRDSKTESDKTVPAGTEVEYLGHLPGQAVSVRLPDGSEEVMHPACFPTLR